MAHFVPANIDSAKEFLTRHHWGVLATRRKNGNLQMSPITPGLDAKGRVIISSRETAYKVKNLRRDPRAALVFLRRRFTAEGGFKLMATRKSFLFRTLWIPWFICSAKSMANTKAGPSFMRERSASFGSLFALRSKAWPRSVADRRLW